MRVQRVVTPGFRRGLFWGGALAMLALVAIVGSGSNAASSDEPKYEPVRGPAREPDPEAGREYLLHGGYIGSGIPLSLWKTLMAASPKPVRRLVRPGVDPSVPDDMNQYRTRLGAEVVSGVNCLGCHASRFRGELVIGMGNSLREWNSGRATYGPLKVMGAVAFKAGSPERVSLDEFIRGAEALEGKTFVPTRGLNPAFQFEAVAASHRNPADLSWSVEPVFVPPEEPVWSDVPAWWNLRKKKTLYYNGMGHGDFARLIQQIGVVMISDAQDTERSLPEMQNVMAYLKTLKPPAYPGTVDPKLRGVGAALFAKKCAECHGTYGEKESYPNKLVPVDKVGTDPVYAQRIIASGLPEWFNKSWFATGGAAYARPEAAYVAPPLDGVWCTAPYFHNGSVPTLEGVLDSRKRPARWERSFDEHDYDVDAPGWRYRDVGAEFVGPPSRTEYDTTVPGCGNQGHTYGDGFTPEERRAVIEYLKTL